MIRPPNAHVHYRSELLIIRHGPDTIRLLPCITWIRPNSWEKLTQKSLNLARNWRYKILTIIVIATTIMTIIKIITHYVRNEWTTNSLHWCRRALGIKLVLLSVSPGGPCDFAIRDDILKHVGPLTESGHKIYGQTPFRAQQTHNDCNIAKSHLPFTDPYLRGISTWTLNSGHLKRCIGIHYSETQGCFASLRESSMLT